MGKIDEACRAYLSDKERFADAFNYYLYGGERVVEPGELEELDASERAGGLAGGRRRDALMGWVAMRGGGAVYAVLGIEAQAGVHYAMPARCLLYDAMRVMAQVGRVGAAHGRRDDLRGDEFVSRFARSDRVAPVVTLVLYLGPREWDGPVRLSEMYAEADPGVLAMAPEYRLNLVAPAAMADGDFSRFRTGLGPLLKFVKYSGDKEKLRAAVAGDARFAALDSESAELASLVTGSRIELGRHEREGMVDMCKAIDDMRQESWDAGREEGLKKGRDEGRDEGREEGRFAALADLVSEGLITDEVAAARLGVSPERFRETAAERGLALA